MMPKLIKCQIYLLSISIPHPGLQIIKQIKANLSFIFPINNKMSYLTLLKSFKGSFYLVLSNNDHKQFKCTKE